MQHVNNTTPNLTCQTKMQLRCIEHIPEIGLHFSYIHHFYCHDYIHTLNNDICFDRNTSL